MEHFAIIGFGCAGYNALKALRENDCGADIDVYSETDLAPYNPMLTTYYVKNKIPYEAMFPFGTLQEIVKKYHCNFYGNTKIVGLDAKKHSLKTSDGKERTYDKILIATGASAVMLPVGEMPRERIFAMRTVDDAVQLKNALEQMHVKTALVVGASMVGIKIVELLLERGIRPVLSDLADHIFASAAFPETSERIENYLRIQGVELHFGVKTEQVLFEEHTGRVTFSDGSRAAADIVVMCVGTKVSCQWLDPEQIKMNRAIIVDKNMKTSAEGIYAAGDCCEGTDLMLETTRNLGLYANAYVQGEVAGSNMAGCSKKFEGNILHNITHFMGMDFVSFGDKNLPGKQVIFQDEGMRYIEATIHNGRIQCINMLDMFELSGVVKNCILHCFMKDKNLLTQEEKGLLAKSGLPNELIQILEGMLD